MNVYIENPKQKNPPGISYYSNVVGHMVNIQKSAAFLYASNKQREFQSENTIPFILASKKMKYLRISLIKMRSTWGKLQPPIKEIKENLSE